MATKKDFSRIAATTFVNKMITEADAVEEKAQKIMNTASGTEERITMILDSIAVEKMRTIAWQDMRKLKAVFADALQMYIADYEAKHGTIKTR